MHNDVRKKSGRKVKNMEKILTETMQNTHEPLCIPNHEFTNYANQRVFLNNLEIGKDSIKAQNRAEIQYNLACKKVILRETEQELKKAQYDKVRINHDGLVTVTTENTILKPKPRELSNFKWPMLIKFTPIDDKTSCIYLFRCEINGAVSEVFLDGEKIGRHSYIQKKLTTIGCQFFLDSKTNDKRYILSLWSILVNDYCNTQRLPKAFGWYKINEKVLFCKKGELTWKTLQEKL